MQVIPAIRAALYARSVEKLSATPSAIRRVDDVRKWQLDQLNQQWEHLCAAVPIYHGLARTGSIPRAFNSHEHFAAAIPAVSKADLQQTLPQRLDATQTTFQFRMTGGSTAQPIRIPICTTETQLAGASTWLARSWLGITPADRLFLLWGHSHLFGRGAAGEIRRWKRQLSDWLIGYYRWSAYDISAHALRAAAEKMIRLQPRYFLGYSVALDAFAEANSDRGDALRKLNLKAVIATAESFPRQDSRDKLVALFGCPVVMEYGSVETGILAQETSPNVYRVLWQNFLIEAIPGDSGTIHPEILVTSLYPRRLPLIRYRLGDLIEVGADQLPIMQIRRVHGRCNDSFTLTNGRRMHSESIAHIVRDVPAILGYQLRVSAQGPETLLMKCKHQLQDHEIERLRIRFGQLDSQLSQIQFCRVDSLNQTVAGKTPTVLRSDSSNGI